MCTASCAAVGGLILAMLMCGAGQTGSGSCLGMVCGEQPPESPLLPVHWEEAALARGGLMGGQDHGGDEPERLVHRENASDATQGLRNSQKGARGL